MWIVLLIGIIAVIVALVVAREKIGVLNAASWLVIGGAASVMMEHSGMAIRHAGGLPWLTITRMPTEEGLTTVLSHARIHFFMAGIYTAIGAMLICVIVRTLLREGRRSGWYAILAVLIIGGTFELVMGALWFDHGLPLFQLFGKQPRGYGWQFQYVYLVAWMAALAISYRPIFAKASG